MSCTLVGGTCGYFIGWAGVSPFEGFIFAILAGIAMYLLEDITPTVFIAADTLIVVILTAITGGIGFLIGISGGGNGLAGLSLGLKVGFLLGILNAVGLSEVDFEQHFVILILIAAGGGAGAGIGALIGLFLTAGAGYGASVGLLIGMYGVYGAQNYTAHVTGLIFFVLGGIAVGFIVGAFSPIGVGIGTMWGLYVALLVRGIILLISTLKTK